ncbi:MAG: hypothetical protein JNK10_09140, partial [Cyclobacteriaceae bacterium]|nr:hypothetical protein [Cyclobacteriaceae bacterium]
MRLTVLLVLAVVVSSMGQQDSVRLDSGSHTHKVPALNGMPQTPMTEATFAAVPLITKDSYRYNQGLSVFNSFRGQVPGMIISPGTQVDTMTWRFNTPVMVVDGIPFKLLPGQVNNLNAFDVESATAILGPNASLPFGGSGSRGALILKSKTGEGFAKPTFEANSYTTYSYGSEDYSGHQWLLSNSLAYGQDFGVVDVRVSGNYQMQPESSNMSKGPDGYGLRINTGLNLGRLSARLILNSNRMDGFQAYYTDFTMSPPISPIPIPPQPSTPERVREALQGNL